MFTGLVTDVGEIVAVEPRGELTRLRIACDYRRGVDRARRVDRLFRAVPDGGRHRHATAIARLFDVDAAAETLARTTVGAWARRHGASISNAR